MFDIDEFEKLLAQPPDAYNTHLLHAMSVAAAREIRDLRGDIEEERIAENEKVG